MAAAGSGNGRTNAGSTPVIGRSRNQLVVAAGRRGGGGAAG